MILALTTAPDEDSATALARALVEERLAACVNRLPGWRSLYRWEGQVREETEVLLLVKTTRERLPALEARLGALHPYDVPELLAFDAVGGLGPYLAWVDQETRAG